jgi:hypothetical protein
VLKDGNGQESQVGLEEQVAVEREASKKGGSYDKLLWCVGLLRRVLGIRRKLTPNFAITVPESLQCGGFGCRRSIVCVCY